MQVSLTSHDGLNVLSVNGRLDMENGPLFESQGVELLQNTSGDVAIDLSGAEYLSSAGLCAIMALTRRLKDWGRRSGLCGARGMVKDVIAITSFSRVIPVYSSIDEMVHTGDAHG